MVRFRKGDAVAGKQSGAKQEYDSCVGRLNSAPVEAFVLAFGALIFLLTPGAILTVAAQINGTPASVNSTNFGGRFTQSPGVPASVTSIGPRGLQPGNQFFPPACCINPLFPVNPNPPLFQRHRHHRQGSFFPAGGAVYVPYPVVAEPEVSDTVVETNPPDDDRGGPTIFDRRGSGQPARYFDDYPRRASRATPEAESTHFPSMSIFCWATFGAASFGLGGAATAAAMGEPSG